MFHGFIAFGQPIVWAIRSSKANSADEEQLLLCAFVLLRQQQVQ